MNINEITQRYLNEGKKKIAFDNDDKKILTKLSKKFNLKYKIETFTESKDYYGEQAKYNIDNDLDEYIFISKAYDARSNKVEYVCGAVSDIGDDNDYLEPTLILKDLEKTFKQYIDSFDDEDGY